MKIIKGRVIKPPRVVIYGPDKIGKTRFGALANALFVCTEEGADEAGADRLPVCRTLEDFYKTFEFALEDAEHDAICVDNLTGLEQLVRADVCRRYGVTSIESVEKGYGKGFAIACEEWENQVIPRFDAAREKNKALICIAHVEVKRFDDPMTEPYDRYGLDLHKGLGEIVRRWTDVLGFAQQESMTKETDVGFNKKRVRAIGLDSTVLRLVGSPAFAAGNRYGLPPVIKFDWASFCAAMSTRMASTEETDKKAAE